MERLEFSHLLICSFIHSSFISASLPSRPQRYGKCLREGIAFLVWFLQNKSPLWLYSSKVVVLIYFSFAVINTMTRLGKERI